MVAMNDYFDWAHSTYHFSTRAQPGSRPGTQPADKRTHKQRESGGSDPVRGGQSKHSNPT